MGLIGKVGNSKNIWRDAGAAFGLVAVILVALFLATRVVRLDSPASGGARALLRLDNALGATVEPVDAPTARILGLSSGAGDDFVVTSVANRGPAVDAGIRVGDVIERIGAQPAAGVRVGALSAASTPVLINRHGKHAIVSVDFAGVHRL